MRSLLLIVLFSAALLSGRAEVTFPHVFSAGMVLQRNLPIPVWGWASPGEKVTVSFADQTQETMAGSDGRWMLKLDPLPASDQPRVLTIGTKKIEDVLVGEVWFCSGQSNMEMCVAPYKTPYRGVENFESELKDANYPQIRFFQVPHTASGLPVPDVAGAWWKCTPESAAWSSAIAFFFGRKLYHDLHVPIGLIDSAWGGSAIQPWTPRSGFAAVPGFEKELAKMDEADQAYAKSAHIDPTAWEALIHENANQPPVPPSAAWIERPALPASGHQGGSSAPSALNNAMVYPVVPYAIRGVIWYQGETNLGDGPLYAERLEALAKGWRIEWNEGDFPFLYVQLAPFAYKGPWPVAHPTPETLPTFWAAQKRALQLIPNSGMVSTEDVGDLDNIHPRRKLQIGLRLAELAEKAIDAASPKAR